VLLGQLLRLQAQQSIHVCAVGQTVLCAGACDGQSCGGAGELCGFCWCFSLGQGDSEGSIEAVAGGSGVHGAEVWRGNVDGFGDIRTGQIDATRTQFEDDVTRSESQ
jgi:hypothetical protein